MAQVSKAELVAGYLLEIETKGLEVFQATTLATLDEARLTGEVGSTGTGDETTTMRLSPIAIDRRYAAALEAVRQYEEALAAGGDRTGNAVGLNYSEGTAGL